MICTLNGTDIEDQGFIVYSPSHDVSIGGDIDIKDVAKNFILAAGLCTEKGIGFNALKALLSQMNPPADIQLTAQQKATIAHATQINRAIENNIDGYVYVDEYLSPQKKKKLEVQMKKHPNLEQDNKMWRVRE